MSENLVVLFRLGKALRRHNAEDFMQQYDTLVEQERLSDYTLINHKEFVRQISELEDEDFSLLECAVEEASLKASLGPCTSRGSQGPLHVGLEAEDLEDSSIAEQLEALLERLRLDSRQQVSSDSGAVSDLESSSGTALGDDSCHLRDEGDRHSDTPRGEVSCGVQVSMDTRAGRGGISTSSTHHGPLPKFGGRGKPISRRNSDTIRTKPSNSRPGVQHMKRGRKATPQTDPEASTPQNMIEKATPVKEMGRSTVIEHPPQTQVVQHYNHQCDSSELKPREETPPPIDEQLVVADTQEHNSEGSSSPTEGGPFITHWGKGRLKRNGNSYNNRDYHSNRRPYNTQYSRQRFSGAHQPRHSARGHSGDTGQSNHRGDVLLRQRGREVGSHYRTGRVRDRWERDKSPQQRKEQQPVVSVAKKTSSVSIAGTPPTQNNTATPSQVPCEKPSEHKLSYASVTGSTNKNAATTKPSPPCNGNKEHRVGVVLSDGKTDTTTTDQRGINSCELEEARAASSDAIEDETVATGSSVSELPTSTNDSDIQSFYRDIAASFNYDEVVDYLRRSWREVMSEVNGGTQLAV